MPDEVVVVADRRAPVVHEHTPDDCAINGRLRTFVDDLHVFKHKINSELEKGAGERAEIKRELEKLNEAFHIAKGLVSFLQWLAFLGAGLAGFWAVFTSIGGHHG